MTTYKVYYTHSQITLPGHRINLYTSKDQGPPTPFLHLVDIPYFLYVFSAFLSVKHSVLDCIANTVFPSRTARSWHSFTEVTRVLLPPIARSLLSLQHPRCSRHCSESSNVSNRCTKLVNLMAIVSSQHQEMEWKLWLYDNYFSLTVCFYNWPDPESCPEQ